MGRDRHERRSRAGGAHAGRTAAVAVAMVVAACAPAPSEPDTPAGAHARLVHAHREGDVEAVWKLLHPDARALLHRWLEAEKEAVRLVETRYPEGAREGALEAFDGGRRADLEDPKALFARLVEGRLKVALSPLQRLGARVRSVERDPGGGGAVVRTWAGDELPYRRGPSSDGSAGEGGEREGRWYASLRERTRRRLERLAERAEANLERVRTNLERLEEAEVEVVDAPSDVAEPDAGSEGEPDQ